MWVFFGLGGVVERGVVEKEVYPSPRHLEGQQNGARVKINATTPPPHANSAVSFLAPNRHGEKKRRGGKKKTKAKPSFIGVVSPPPSSTCVCVPPHVRESSLSWGCRGAAMADASPPAEASRPTESRRPCR